MAIDLNDPRAGKVAGILYRAGTTSVNTVRPLTLGGPADADIPGVYTSDRRLYLNDSGEVVEEGDESASFLLVGEGGALPQSLADELGVKPNKKKAAAAKDAAPTPEPITVIANPADDVPLPEGAQTVGPAVPADGPPTNSASGPLTSEVASATV